MISIGYPQRMFLERIVRVATTGVAKQHLIAGCDTSVVDLHAEQKGSTPRPVGKTHWHLDSGKQVEKGVKRSGPRSTRGASFKAG